MRPYITNCLCIIPNLSVRMKPKHLWSISKRQRFYRYCNTKTCFINMPYIKPQLPDQKNAAENSMSGFCYCYDWKKSNAIAGFETLQGLNKHFRAWNTDRQPHPPHHGKVPHFKHAVYLGRALLEFLRTAKSWLVSSHVKRACSYKAKALSAVDYNFAICTNTTPEVTFNFSCPPLAMGRAGIL